MLTFWRARTKDFGAHILAFDASTSSITASATTTIGLGAFNDKDDTGNAGHTCYVDEIFVFANTKPAGGAGITLNIKKFSVTANAVQTLVTSFDLVGGLTNQKAERLPLDATATDAFRTMLYGDTLYAEVVAAGTVTTQPVALTITAKIKLLT